MILPEPFQHLSALGDKWARPTEHERNAIRWQASREDFAEFYAAAMPELDAILARLDTCGLETMDEGERNLFSLAAAFAEAAPHHELYGGSADVPFSFAARRFVPGHGERLSWATDFR